MEAAIIGVLRANRGAAAIAMIRAVRVHLGDNAIVGLDRHLTESGSRMAVDDFIIRCLWDGHARRLWDREQDTWVPKT